MRSLEWQLRWWAAEIWVSRHLSLEEQLALLAEQEYLGTGITGLRAGARAFYGVDLELLSDEELATLCVLTGGRYQHYGLSTSPDLIERRDWILIRLVEEGFWEAARKGASERPPPALRSREP